MNIPKPVIVVGLLGLIGAYVATQSASSPGGSAASTHTHADGTVHEGASHGDEGGGSEAPAVPEGVTKLQITDLKKGSGATATEGKNLTMHYRGTLTNGKQFDASYDKGQPFIFTLGKGEVIKGWDQGVKGMKVGGKRRLVVPSSLGYGASGTPDGSIPPNSTLVFEVELLAVT